MSSGADVEAAVDAARDAFGAWSSKSVKERCSVLFRYQQLVENNLEAIAASVTAENGKNRNEALGSVLKANETNEYACSMPQLIAGKMLEVGPGITCREVKKPLGVVASITPFNFPFMVPNWTVPITLACGNTMILKPSEKTPIGGAILAELLEEAGLPKGVFNVVNGAKDTVEAICDSEGIDAVTFVGSSTVAKIVYERSILSGKRCTALGAAKNHLVAVPDACLEMTSNDIVNSFTGCAGQRCMMAGILLTVGKQNELIESVKAKAAKIQPGVAPGQMGPIIDAAGRDHIMYYVDMALKDGAELLLDGRSWMNKEGGNWLGPTILKFNDPEHPCMKEELFGPVLSIYECKDREEAIHIENSNPYGNAAAVYTSSGDQADWFTSRFQAGMMGVGVGVPVPREPFSFGGINLSRFGCHDITGESLIDLVTSRRKITQKWVPPPQERRTWMD
eukprot:TRINITY_DN1002_c0_g1_i3.p1 TRINITY_DN1002_c0_g1~~TRINITY_DN1002_c0_g1_i3.p1  ORF type:complete len:516 (-),score=157.63 TRINITY_DN1002_c0_g1_i3:148-1500(-)